VGALTQRHLFHLVNPSPWPLVTSLGSLGLTIGAVGYFHSFINGGLNSFYGFLIVAITASIWWRDVIRESLFEGFHTTPVQQGMKLGMLLFILSEVMFFSSFFWAFFHASLAASIELGGIWPPKFINALDPWGVPLLNTVVLVFSGASITWSHHALLLNFRDQVDFSFRVTILWAVLFTLLQLCEYVEATFSISDSVYGSTFFMATGFHGFHVIVGTIFIFVSYIRFINYHFSSSHHIGFESSAWYWHFVDVVWLFLFISIYWWGNKNCFISFIGDNKTFVTDVRELTGYEPSLLGGY